MMIHRETRWGAYTVIDMGPGYVAKRLEIKTGECISLQYHNYRTENWIVVEGTGLMKLGSVGSQTLRQLSPGSTVFIPTGIVHQVKATSDLKIIEVWRGPSKDLTEEDIVRVSYDWQD